MENLPFGVRAETRVERLLQTFSWRTRRTIRSLGPFDVFAESGSSKVLVQVKAVRTTTAIVSDAAEALRLLERRLAGHARARLCEAAVLFGACPMACLVNGSRAWLFDLTARGLRLNFEAPLPSLRVPAMAS